MNDYYSTGYFIGVSADPWLKPSFGAWAVTSRYEIMSESGVKVEDIGNGKAWIENRNLDRRVCRTGFYDRYISQRTHTKTYMLGAICGDVAGSVYEHHNIKYIPDKDRLICHDARFTDDSVLTLAVGVGIMNAIKKLKKSEGFTKNDEEVFLEELTKSVHYYGNRYPFAGYGGSFRRWLHSDNPSPYNSWGNGSAMRVSYAGYIAKSLEDTEFIASASAKITHNHPEGIKGAVAIAGSIQILKNSLGNMKIDEAKREVYNYVSKMYDLNFTLDSIRNDYKFDVSCSGSVPQAVKAFLEGNSFEEVLALAISIGGDSDTIAAMAGSLAEVIYPIPDGIRDRVLKRLDYSFKSELAQIMDFMMNIL